MAKRFEKAKEYTEKYASHLLPCKYCGNTNIVIVSDRTIFPKPKDVWGVCCSIDKCGCSGVHTSVRKAIQEWNEINRPGGAV